MSPKKSFFNEEIDVLFCEWLGFKQILVDLTHRNDDLSHRNDQTWAELVISSTGVSWGWEFTHVGIQSRQSPSCLSTSSRH